MTRDLPPFFPEFEIPSIFSQVGEGSRLFNIFK
jgi:hypothetical protein